MGNKKGADRLLRFNLKHYTINSHKSQGLFPCFVKITFINHFPINTNFVGSNYDVFPATVFDEILDDVFDGDMDKIRLLYQILGAIMSNINLKHIFVFQGKCRYNAILH